MTPMYLILVEFSLKALKNFEPPLWGREHVRADNGKMWRRERRGGRGSRPRTQARLAAPLHKKGAVPSAARIAVSWTLRAAPRAVAWTPCQTRSGPLIEPK